MRIESLQVDLRKVEDALEGAVLGLQAGDPSAAWRSFALSHYPLGRLSDHYRELLSELEALAPAVRRPSRLGDG